MTTRKRKKIDPFNEEIREFRTGSATPLLTRRSIMAMKQLGCKSRTIYLEMAMEFFNRHVLPDKQDE